jgi:hypothetical protein
MGNVTRRVECRNPSQRYLPHEPPQSADKEDESMASARMIGAYRVRSSEPCHLVELEITGVSSQIDLSEITQEVPGQPRSNWQVPYDEQYLDVSGKRPIDPSKPWAQPQEPDFRLVFFFHYLDFDEPLLTPFGDIELPKPKRKPRRLGFVRYEPPF